MATYTELSRRSGIEVLTVDEMWAVQTLKSDQTDVIGYGDLLDHSSNEAILTTAAAGSTSMGICLEDSPGIDIEADPKISVALRCTARVKVATTATAIVPGNGLAWASGPTLAEKQAGTQVDFTFTNTATHAICWALESKASGADGTIKVIFDVPTLKALDADLTFIQTATN